MRTFVTFEHPSIEEGRFDSHGELIPGGRPILDAVRDRMAQRGHSVTEVEEHESYGWCFYTEVHATRVWSMLQFAEPWLIIVEVPVRWLQRLKGRRVDDAQQCVCLDLHEVLSAIPDARNVRWYTRSEFGRGNGSPVP